MLLVRSSCLAAAVLLAAGCSGKISFGAKAKAGGRAQGSVGGNVRAEGHASGSASTSGASGGTASRDTSSRGASSRGSTTSRGSGGSSGSSSGSSTRSPTRSSTGSTTSSGGSHGSSGSAQFPSWVMSGSVPNTVDGHKLFTGVGSASGIDNRGLAMATADNRARAEVAKVFEVYSASLMKDYMASTGAGGASSEEQHVEQAIKTISIQTLRGVVIADHWFHPDGTVYSRALLDLSLLTERLPEVEKVGDRIKDYVRKNADRVHSDLEAEAAKRGGAK